jgi:Peptidase family M1 domain
VVRERAILGACALVAFSFAQSAHATPIPRYQMAIAHPVAPVAPLGPSLPLAENPFSTTRVLAADTVLTLDPVTGSLDAHTALTIEAESGSVGQVSLLVDSGLSVTAATASGNTVGVSDTPYPPYDYATLVLATPLSAGQQITIDVSYGGVLSCSGGASQAEALCYLGAPLAYAMEGSALPIMVDQDGYGGWNVWGAERSVELHLPTKTGAIASGDLVSQSDDGTSAVSKWSIPGYLSLGANVLLMGDLGTTAVPGASPTTDVYTVASAPKWSSEWSSWMQKILPFMEAQAGQPLPYSTLKVMKLPLGWTKIFRGSAGHALTMLSEDYATPDADYFEETLAHENSHQWWGVLVSPTDSPVARWLSEGLAVQSQIDYRAQKLPAAERDAYLARRYREHWILVRYSGDPSLPQVLPSLNEVPIDTVGNTLWAYIRSSALLEHLRVVVGDAVFGEILKQWAGTCGKAVCDSHDFQTVMETVTGQSFADVFAQFVFDGRALEPALGFSQDPGGTTISVTASGNDGTKLTLELFLELESGETVKQLVTFDGSGSVTVDVPGPVRRVRPNPLHDGFVWSRSAVDEDFDFDGEVDGLDVIHAAWRLGRVADPGQPDGEGVWSTELDFDPRVDADGDGKIGDPDLTAVSQAFGNVKEAP